jgi:hypothetical protein
VPATGAPVAADAHFQHRRAPAQRLVRQPPDHRVPRDSLAAAATTPPVRLHDTTGQHRPIRLESLPGDFKAELVEPAERGQVRASETSVTHVEVFRMSSRSLRGSRSRLGARSKRTPAKASPETTPCLSRVLHSGLVWPQGQAHRLGVDASAMHSLSSSAATASGASCIASWPVGRSWTCHSGSSWSRVRSSAKGVPSHPEQ